MPRREQLSKKGLHEDARRLRSVPRGSSGAGVAAHNLLGAAHNDTVTAAVVEGAMVLGDDTPEWNILLHPTVAGYALVTTATTATWDQTPTWTGRHSWDDGVGVVSYIDEDGSAWFTGNAAIGPTAVNANILLLIADTTHDTTANTYGLFLDVIKTAGATDTSDVLTGAYFRSYLNQAAGTVGTLRGMQAIAQINDGSVGSGGVPRSLRGIDITADLDGGLVYGDAVGAYITVDQEAGGTVSGDVFGAWVSVDADGTVTGDTYLARLQGLSNVDYGIYETGAGSNFLQADTSIGGTIAPAAQLRVDQGSAAGAQPAVFIDQGDFSEQHIVFSMDGADQDFPALLQLNVTGTPTLWWDESEDAFSLTNDLVIEPRCFGFLKAQDADGRIGNGPVEYGEVVATGGIMEVAPAAALYATVTIN